MHQHLSRNEYITKTHKYIDQTKLTVLNSHGMCFAVIYNNAAEIYYKPLSGFTHVEEICCMTRYIHCRRNKIINYYCNILLYYSLHIKIKRFMVLYDFIVKYISV